MSEQQNFYLKYRPTQLEDMVGQKQVISTLKQASLKNEFSHAYLFSGTHGSGKTSSARILATLMTCEKVVNGKVCGVCRSCRAIHDGASVDVKELDGAANRGIDNVKSLIDAAQWSPQELKKKIYILDETHCLTKEANSALLKTLEEPPSYLNFILCTTDANKMLPTILSRCQRFNFTKISSKDITQRLMFIADKEEIKIEESAANIIAKMARGSMRDAIGYLEQIGTVAAGKSIVSSHIQKYFGLTDRLAILNIIKAIVTDNVPLILDQVNDMIMASVDPKQILFEVTEMLRSIMVLKAMKGDAKLIDLPDNEIQDLNKLGESIAMPQLLKMSHLFSEVDKKIAFNINERWIMEAALINCVAILRK
jgi:DNA polymerase-3 subunit gamma/tau